MTVSLAHDQLKLLRKFTAGALMVLPTCFLVHASQQPRHAAHAAEMCWKQFIVSEVQP